MESRGAPSAKTVRRRGNPSDTAATESSPRDPRAGTVAPAPIRPENDAFEGQNDAYLLDGAVTTLVDTGTAAEHVHDRLVDRLAAEGVGVDGVDRLLVTRRHADHAGLAGDPAATETGVYAGRDDAGPVVREVGTETAPRARHADRFTHRGYRRRPPVVGGDPPTVPAPGDPSDPVWTSVETFVPTGAARPGSADRAPDAFSLPGGTPRV